MSIQFEIPYDAASVLEKKPNEESLKKDAGQESDGRDDESSSKAPKLMIEDEEGNYKESLPGLPVGPLLLLTVGLQLLNQF